MRLLVASSIDPDSVRRMEYDHDVVCAVDAPEAELMSAIRDREAVIFRSGVSISAAVMRCAPDLKLLIRAGSGTDNLDLGYVRALGLQLVRIPQPGARAVAELTLGLMLGLARSIGVADREWRAGRWVKNQLSGYLLRDKVLGIVGVGNIGSEVGRLGAAMGMTVVGCVEHPSPWAAANVRQHGVKLTRFDHVVESADFLSLHVPLQDSTRGLIGREVLSRMKPGSFLLNLARGGVVDEAALREALLDGGRLRGAALDVHEREGNGRISPLADLPNVILTPHIGASTVDTKREIGERILEALRDYVAAQTEKQTA